MVGAVFAAAVGASMRNDPESSIAAMMILNRPSIRIDLIIILGRELLAAKLSVPIDMVVTR